MQEGISPYIYGIHDEGAEHLLDGKGWVVITEELGADPANHGGRDYTHLTRQGLGVIVRLNYSHTGQGTLPVPDLYAQFAARCANFVRASRGCSIWIVGNEPNHSQEWPAGQAIAANEYATCFRRVRESIHAVASNAQVLVAAIAPWNIETGDWLAYFRRVLELLGPDGCDGLALHTYTHGYAPSLITSSATMDAPFADRFFHFRAYQDFLGQVPPSMRHLPVYITETNQDDPWLDNNNGWVRAAFDEIERWNRRPDTQKIRLLALYRWADHDRWTFRHKNGVQDALRAAVRRGYRWPEPEPEPAAQPTQNTLFVPFVLNENDNEPGPTQDREWDDRLDALGVTLREAHVSAGQAYWRLVTAEWLDPEQAQGLHHIFVDALDFDGRRVTGVPVRFFWQDGEHVRQTEAKPHEAHATDHPMFNAGPAFGTTIADGVPADTVWGMGLGTPAQPRHAIHTSFRLVWQRAVAKGEQMSVPEQQETVTQPTPIGEQPPMPTGIVDPYVALAVLQVESGNRPFIDNLLTIRFEVHRFQALLRNDALFHRHFRFEGRDYSAQYWRTRPDAPWQHAHGPMAERHELLTFARTLDDTAALRATGMGTAQIMGENHRRVGYATVQAMFNAFAHSGYGIQAQLTAFFNYCLSDARLMHAIRQRDWREIATRYNGQGQQHIYAPRLAHALAAIQRELSP